MRGWRKKKGEASPLNEASSSSTPEAAPPKAAAADEETALRRDDPLAQATLRKGGEGDEEEEYDAAVGGAAMVCFSGTKCVLAIPVMLMSLVLVLMFWTLWILLLPVKHCCQCKCLYGKGGLFEWLEKGAKLPPKLLGWALS